MMTTEPQTPANTRKIRHVQTTVTTLIYTPHEADMTWFRDEGLSNIDMVALRDKQALVDGEWRIADIVPEGALTIETEVETKIVEVDEDGNIVGYGDPNENNKTTDKWFEKVPEEPEED